jgi:hypothetical protein
MPVSTAVTWPHPFFFYRPQLLRPFLALPGSVRSLLHWWREYRAHSLIAMVLGVVALMVCVAATQATFEVVPKDDEP